jgi:predicted ATPase
VAFTEFQGNVKAPMVITVSVNELVGRDAELTLLANYVDELLAGTGRATLIEGEPGIGKSSIARATATRAEQRGCRVEG